ncbi:MAG: hypothetical protein KME56_18360 [Candidatus Thiodiazotropha sp. (ex Ctena orbiculata)]|nr:hypothetical protein [Candidatus Thiodiazotropha taylori]MBT2998576.1 hypothetical protein [Candidatus Thiodiazotropha taylori]MBT3002750.1 hypothetical protein [Candidatus Thiodiazotropha taylori]MBV2109009.1 hypothetical protein [Candidatus Thiodiazotropha taylori]MBV2113034.1 hypothetical protein [Candidatus Thiodiazotropha taylori]
MDLFKKQLEKYVGRMMFVSIWETYKASRIAPILAMELERQIQDSIMLCGDETVVKRLSTYVSTGYMYSFLRYCLLFKKSIYDLEVKHKWIRKILKIALPYESQDNVGRMLAPVLLGYRVEDVHVTSFSRGCDLGESDALKYCHKHDEQCNWLCEILTGAYQKKLKEPVTILFRDYKFDECPMVEKNNYLESIEWLKREQDLLDIDDEIAEFKYRFSTITVKSKIEGKVEYINRKKLTEISLDEPIVKYSSLETGSLN